MIASDGFANVTQSFILLVENHAPIAYHIPDYILVFGTILNYEMLFYSPFVDPDNDTLHYHAFEIYDNRSLGDLPGWLDFDEEGGTFSGSPNKSYIPKNQIDGSFYKAYNILVVAIDAGDLSNSTNFTLIVRNSVPKTILY